MRKLTKKQLKKLTMKYYLKLVDSGADVSMEQVEEIILEKAKAL